MNRSKVSERPGVMSVEVLKKLDEIEAEMRRIGYWSDSPDLVASIRGGKFRSYLDAPSLELWLQALFLPHARAAAREGRLPAYSQAGAIARRHYEHHSAVPEAAKLLTLIEDFDRLCLEASRDRKA